VNKIQICKHESCSRQCIEPCGKKKLTQNQLMFGSNWISKLINPNTQFWSPKFDHLNKFQCTSFQALATLTFLYVDISMHVFSSPCHINIFICWYTPLKTYLHQNCKKKVYICENINKIEKMQKMLILYIIWRFLMELRTQGFVDNHKYSIGCNWSCCCILFV
jgi:hypothetical protein